MADILRVKYNGQWHEIPALVGPDGTTFTPSVDAQGNLSWTNDGGKQNPPTVNIKGPMGNGIVSIDKTGTSGLVDTYTVTYDNGYTATFTVTNGKDGEPGQDGQDGSPGADGTSAYVWIRYSATQPTQDSDMKTTPDAWMGIYSGDSATAPTAYTAYTWYNIKGQTGPVSDVQVNGTSAVQDGVANVPEAGSSTYGAVKVDSNKGIDILGGVLHLKGANGTEVKYGSASYRAIVASMQHAATFYGLAKASGDTTQSASSNAVGTYTDSAKQSIQHMLGVSDMIATIESTSSASRAYEVGERMVFNGKLCKVTDPIPAGTTIAIGTNVEETTIDTELNHGVSGATVGQTVRIASVNSNGVPTSWEPVDIYPKKILDQEIADCWYRINVTSVDYATGILTLETNDAPFTDNWDTTCRILFVPLLEGIRKQYKLGMMPQELYKTEGSYIRGRLVNANQIEIKVGDNVLSSLTETDNIDLSRWQVFAEKNPQNYKTYSFDIFQPNHKYHIKLFLPHGAQYCKNYECAPVLRAFADVVDSYNAYGDGYGNGYSARSITLNSNLDGIAIRGANNYEYLPRYLLEGYGTSSYNDGAIWRRFPCYFEADVYPLSQETWIYDTKMSFFPIRGNTTFDKNSVPSFTTIPSKAYINGRPKGLKVTLGIEGQRLTVWDLGTVY